MSTRHQPCGKPGCLNCWPSTSHLMPGQAPMQNMEAPIHPLQQTLRDNGDLIALRATVAQQAQMIEHLKGAAIPCYTAVDVANAASDGRSSLIEILLEQMSLKQYPEDRLDAECSAYNSALEDVRQMLRSVKE